MLLTTVTSVDPAASSHDAAASTDVSATFDQNINEATATAQTFAVHSMQRGQLVGATATVDTSGSTVTLDPASDFFPGELVQASITAGIQGSGGQPVDPHVWQLRTAVSFGSGQFSDSGQDLGTSNSRGGALGDLDGDGDLDAFVANHYTGNYPGQKGISVWLNNSGQFIDSGQSLGDY
jgi:hypothetical protein